jgi:hypothetical protein
MNETKYKGKNIRVSDEHHSKVVSHIPKKTTVGGWVEEAIDEKIERERSTEKVQYDEKNKPITALDCVKKFDETSKIPEIKDFT